MRNNPLFNPIFVDIDVKYNAFMKSRLKFLIDANLKKIRGIDEVWIRSSSHGNVHLKLVMVKPVDFCMMMQIRALCHDDHYRLGLDLRRYYLQGANEVNRIFDVKNEGVAGEWRRYRY